MDLKSLVAKLKENGMDVAEDAAVVVVETVLDWVTAEVIASPNKVDDLLLVLMPVIRAQLLGLVDKIDGKDDPAI